MKAPIVSFDSYSSMPLKSESAIPGYPGWVVWRDRFGGFSVRRASQVRTWKKLQEQKAEERQVLREAGFVTRKEKKEREAVEELASSGESASETANPLIPVQENPMARNRYDEMFDYYEQEMGPFGNTMDLPVNRRNNPRRRKVSKSPKAVAWREMFGAISRRAKDIQIAKNCAWGIAWNQARAEIQGRAAANPYRENAGRRTRWVGSPKSGHSETKPGRPAPFRPFDFGGNRPMSMWTKDELVADGSALAVAELARRGRASDGVKLAWKEGKRVKKAANNPWDW